MDVTITVPDDSQLATDMESWTDGAQYTLTVKQTSTGKFEGISGEPAEEETPEEETASDEEKDSGPPMPKMGKKEMGMPPAIMVMMGGKRK